MSLNQQSWAASSTGPPTTYDANGVPVPTRSHQKSAASTNLRVSGPTVIIAGGTLRYFHIFNRGPSPVVILLDSALPASSGMKLNPNDDWHVSTEQEITLNVEGNGLAIVDYWIEVERE